MDDYGLENPLTPFSVQYNYRCHYACCPNPQLHSTVLVPFFHYHHFHPHSNLCSMHHCDSRCHPSPSIFDRPMNDSVVSREGLHNRSVTTNLRCCTGDCSPCSVICHVLSSSSGPYSESSPPTCHMGRSNALSEAQYHNVAGTSSSMITMNHPSSNAANGGSSTQLQRPQRVMDTHHCIQPSYSACHGIEPPHYFHSSSDSLLATSGHGRSNLHVAAATTRKSIHSHQNAERKDTNRRNMGIAYSSKQQNTSLKPAYAEREEPLQIDQWGSEGDRKPKLDRKCNEEDRCDYAQSGKFMCDSRNAQLRLHSSIKKAANVNGNTDAVACQGELATAEPAPLLRHVDAEAGHGHSVDTTVRPRFRSKWEDAERWLRPAASEQRLQQEGCTPSLPNFGLLKMSDCMNRGAVIHPYFPVHHRSTSSIHSSSASANPHDKIGSSNVAVHGERATGKHPASSRMQSIQIGCFDSPYTAICATDSAFRKQLPSVEQAACIRGGALVRPRFSYPQRNCGDMRKSTMYCLSNRHHEDSGRMEDRSIDYSSSKEVNPLVGERNMLPPDSLSTTMEANTTAHSAGISKTAALFASSQMHLSHVARMDSDKMIIPLISMRDMGTQISSGDCSGSISRYTSENASPRRHSGMLLPSPAGHNTPAGMASLSGSASNSRHLKAGAGSDRGGSGGAKHLSTAPCIALELQVRLHSAERHLRSSSSPVSLSSSSSSSSSSPTLSNHRRCQEDSTQSSEPITQRHRHSLSDWSSRKTVQIELGRGFEQRNPELKTGSNDRHVRFCSPWNIDGQDSSKLPKTGCNKLRSQRMGDTIDEEDDHKLKQSERSQSTMRMNDILHNTREKAEKMRTRTYVTKTGSTKFRHLRARSLSLSPVSRCTCFSILQ